MHILDIESNVDYKVSVIFMVILLIHCTTVL